MSATYVARPTEDTAIGRAILRPTPTRTAADMYFLLTLADARRDGHGARLFFARYLRMVAGGRAGERL